MKEFIHEEIKKPLLFVNTFIKWLIISLIIGIICGFIGTLFHHSLIKANLIRMKYEWILYALPFAGCVIVYIYKLFHMENDKGTNLVIESISSEEEVPKRQGLLIFISTILTHLFGGSAGREGAALQIGASIASAFKRVVPVKEEDKKIITMCGMAGMFSAVFCTPITAAIFSMEVISIGIFHYSALIPCMFSAIIATRISSMFGVYSEIPSLITTPDFHILLAIKVSIIALCAALGCILFCTSLKRIHTLYTHYLKNPYYRIMAGGIIIILLTLLVKNQTYNGSGMNLIIQSFTQDMSPFSFLIKIIFTIVTLGAGYKGGEIVPSLCIGALIGNFVGNILGLDPAFGASLGMIAFFCGVVNCPIASIFLSIELFGASGLLFYCISCSISYMFSGYVSLYSGQKIMYSKLQTKYINIKTK